jgi:hypothetical protein
MYIVAFDAWERYVVTAVHTGKVRRFVRRSLATPLNVGEAGRRIVALSWRRRWWWWR